MDNKYQLGPGGADFPWMELCIPLRSEQLAVKGQAEAEPTPHVLLNLQESFSFRTGFGLPSHMCGGLLPITVSLACLAKSRDASVWCLNSI